MGVREGGLKIVSFRPSGAGSNFVRAREDRIDSCARRQAAERVTAMNARPVFVLFGSSIVQYSFSNGGWGATLADIYARKVLPSVLLLPLLLLIIV